MYNFLFIAKADNDNLERVFERLFPGQHTFMLHLFIELPSHRLGLLGRVYVIAVADSALTHSCICIYGEVTRRCSRSSKVWF